MPSNGNGPDTGSTQGTPPDANAPDGYVADSANGADPDGSATTSGDAGAMTPGCQTGQALRASTPSSEEFNGPYASWMSVKTFGAAGDGQTDDTAAIQQALDALKNVSTNTWSTLYFPPGTYLISSELTTTRSGSNDYQGSDIVGDDPTTTTIKWTGAAGGTMFYLDAWYNKVGRLTFDGGGMAGTGLLRGPSFATYGELSDLQFQNITGTCLLLGTDTTQGIAEQSILRDRFYGCQYGVGTWNYNSLDVYVWNSYFQGNSQAIRNATGAFHAYQNVFVGSTSSDLASYTNMQSAIVGNVSVGSAAFLANFGASAVLQGNFIYATATNGFDISQAQATVLDNVFVLPGGIGASQVQGDALLAGNVFVGSNAWPFQPAPQEYDNGMGADAVNGHPVEDAIGSDPSSYAVLYLTATGSTHLYNGVSWNTPPGTVQTVVSYALTQAGDPNDAPSSFQLLGSNDWGNSWTTLDSETAQTFAAGQTLSYPIADPGAYSLYQLRVTVVAADLADGGPQYGESWVAIQNFQLMNGAGTNIVTDPNGLLTAADETWGGMFAIDTTLLSDGACGPAPTPQPWPFVAKVARPVFDVTGFTDVAIQQAIFAAAMLHEGTKPVVHLPKGSYQIASSVTVPAGVEMSIVGDGASSNGTSLSWTGSTPAPVLVLSGPSRATVRDLSISSESGPGLVVDDADQPGGRVYSNQLWCSGFGFPNNVASTAFEIDGVEQADVTMTGYNMNSFSAGVQATGGPARASGGTAPGQVAFLSGSSSSGNANYGVAQGGQVIVNGSYFEQDSVPSNPVPIIDLGASSSGNLTFAAGILSVTNPSLPILETDGFSGTLTVLGSQLFVQPGMTPTPDLFQFQGNGSATNVFGADNQYPYFTGTTAAELWVDTTSPAGSISQIGSGVADYTNQQTGVAPTPTFVRGALAQLQALRVEQPFDWAPGVTDVKIFRVLVTSGNGQATCAIHAM
jgi:hypothetical protein